MNSTALHDLFRSEVRDDSAPYLWSSPEIYSYIDDAQKMFCRLQGGISDASSAITSLTVSANTTFVSISPLILKLRAATLQSDYSNLEILNYEDVQPTRENPRPDYRMDNTRGRVEALVTGVEPNKVRLIRIPDAEQTINLVVYRLPLVGITGPAQNLEIDEHHHRHLLLWMKHLAHQKQDAETFDRGRSDAFSAQFVAYCDQARSERERREHKFRTIAYGGY